MYSLGFKFLAIENLYSTVFGLSSFLLPFNQEKSDQPVGLKTFSPTRSSLVVGLLISFITRLQLATLDSPVFLTVPRNTIVSFLSTLWLWTFSITADFVYLSTTIIVITPARTVAHKITITMLAKILGLSRLAKNIKSPAKSAKIAIAIK